MKTILPLLFLSSLAVARAEVVFQHDFESDTPSVGKPIHTMTANDAKIEVVNSVREPAAGKPGVANQALMIQGGEEEKHDWQPAGDVDLGELSTGFLHIGFQVKNASFEPALFGIQLADKQETYLMFQRFRLYPDRFNVSGTGRGMAREQVSAGKDGKWMRIEWIVPLPQTEDAVPTLSVNGRDQGAISFEPMTEGQKSINNLRFWLPTLRGEDTKFFVDDILIVAAPTWEALEEAVDAARTKLP